MSSVMNFAAARMRGEFILVGYEEKGEQFKVWTGVGQRVCITMLEAAAHQLLRRIVEIQSARTDDCSGCDQCQSRIARAEAAMVALGDLRFFEDEPKAGPTSEAMH